VPSISPGSSAARWASDPAARHQPPGQAHVVEQGLDHQRLAAGFHRRHQVGGTAAEAAVGLGQRDRGQAHLGKGAPHLGAATLADLMMALRCSKS
jgi:hypothetical protein